MQTYAELRQHYLDQGYSSLGISTRTGAEILRNPAQGRVVKLTIAGKDPSVLFSQWVFEHPLECLPRVFDIVLGDRIEPRNEVNWRPCAIEMEELQALNSEERDRYERWIHSYLEWRNGRIDRPEDSLGLLQGLDAVFDQANGLGGALAVDVRKPKTVMAREQGGKRQIVVLDPWY